MHLHDDLAVGHHHAHAAEEGLQVLRQLLATGVPRVHGDEDADARVQADSAAVGENKRLLALPDGAQDAVHLPYHTAASGSTGHAIQGE